jgi:hypothetical protein
MEIDLPQYGWIPFTADPADVEEIGREMYARAVAGDFGPIAEYVPPPPPEPYIAAAQANKAEAARRLQDTDWVNQPDVYDPARNPHLMNRDVFLDYRSQIRAIAVNPTAGNLNWPTEPSAVWS